MKAGTLLRAPIETAILIHGTINGEGITDSIRDQIWRVNIWVYTVFESIVGSDYYIRLPVIVLLILIVLLLLFIVRSTTGDHS